MRQRGNDVGAQQHVGVQPLAPQIEIAIFEADFLGIFILAEHRHRQFLRRRLYHDIAGAQFDFAGRQRRIHRLGRTRHHIAGDGDDRLGAQFVEHRMRRAVAVGYDLGDAIMVAQIDEQEVSVVALAVDPAGKLDRGPDIGGAKLGTGMSAIGVHKSSHVRRPGEGRGRCVSKRNA